MRSVAVTFDKPVRGPVSLRHHFACPNCGAPRLVFYARHQPPPFRSAGRGTDP